MEYDPLLFPSCSVAKLCARTSVFESKPLARTFCAAGTKKDSAGKFGKTNVLDVHLNPDSSLNIDLLFRRIQMRLRCIGLV